MREMIIYFISENYFQLGNYPDIRVSRDQARIASCRENVKSAFIPQEKTVWQKALHAWWAFCFLFVSVFFFKSGEKRLKSFPKALVDAI